MSPLHPTPVVPVAPALVEHTMDVLHMYYVMERQDAEHIRWLLSVGLIRAVDARAVCVSLGLEERSRPLSASALEPSPGITPCPQTSQALREAPAPKATESGTENVLLTGLPALELPALPPMVPVPQWPPPQRQLDLQPSLVPSQRPEGYSISSPTN